MLLKDNQFFELPQLSAGFFSGLDRLDIPYEILILRKVHQREDNGDIQLVCQAIDGPEEKQGMIRFSTDDRSKKDALYSWLELQIGKSIETIYNSEFDFETSSLKDCPKCESEMFQSMEPLITNLASVVSIIPNQIRFWRCSNRKCDYKEEI
jgi:predicted nucleic-acid-binding Zn-ribbon protein